MLIFLWLFWVILNGQLTLEIAIIGGVVTAAVSLFCYRTLGYSFALEKRAFAKTFGILAYLCLLVVEVIKANIAIIKLICSPKIEVHPQIVYFKSPVKTQTAQVALSSSITLTPGTIVVSLEENVFGVHALDASFNEGIEESVFVSKLKKLEGR